MSDLAGDIEAEYHSTLRILAVIAERLLRCTGASAVLIDERSVANSPDLIASRNGETGQIRIRVAR